ncbi:glycosyltransferase [Methylomonas montana]|uniref:glycosyltransferase n=1 Tax=Methylomonas montana TaxID=3058963 RepID=UPI00265934E4|nr:glycosyltransferase [Methylomonas montana]WKJ89574.1 glycosyltransferase [Methylomonas montana]
MNTKRILFFAETVTLAHVARCIKIANELARCKNYSIMLAADSRFDQMLGLIKFKRIDLYSISCTEFKQRLQKGMPIYNVNELTRYVNEELEIIDEVKPDFVIGDFRLTLAISCRLRKVPFATITNAYWSPYANIEYPVPEMILTKILGVRFAQKIFDFVRPFVFKIHTNAFNKVCKKFGHSGLVKDLREMYTDADFTFYADLDSFIPMKHFPSSHLFIGPVLWSAPVPLPDWWDRVPAENPIIFITLGSSGDSSVLPLLLQTLSAMQVTVICATVDDFPQEMGARSIFLSKYLPADVCVKKADVVICNGGSPMVYQSLIENKPLIGIPSNLDQFLMMSLVEKLGHGVLIRPSQVSSEKIMSAVNRTLSNKNRPEVSEDRLFDARRISELIDSVT